MLISAAIIRVTRECSCKAIESEDSKIDVEIIFSLYILRRAKRKDPYRSIRASRMRYVTGALRNRAPTRSKVQLSGAIPL
jgi:hypothetical protein